MDEGGADLSRKMSRREFLKLFGFTGCVIGLNTIGAIACVKFFMRRKNENSTAFTEAIKEPPVKTQPAQHEQQFPSDLIFTGEERKFEGEAARIIEGVEKDAGVKIISPLTWEENGQIKDNLPWSIRDIALVAESVSQLPPEYRVSARSPKEILLLRTPGSMSEGAGGGYGSRRLVLFTSETFSPDEKLHGYAGELYGYQRDHLRAAVHHEYTHSFTEAYPEVGYEWIEKTGWKKAVSGTWINDRPQNLILDGGADKSPSEDMAVSTSVMLVNPKMLSYDRRDFFLTNEHYSSWPTVQAFKQKQNKNKAQRKIW